jgi:amino acid transporter
MLMFGITTTLHGLSPLATYGLGSVFFLLIAVVFFLVPAGMVAAELATAWPRDGGVYVWVSKAFGTRVGFLATWLQWSQDVVFWTVILTGSATMLAIGFGWHGGTEHKLFTASIVLGAIWLTTGFTLLGMRSTGWVGTVGSILGTIVPGAVLISCAIVYIAQGHPSNMSFSLSNLIPDLAKPGNITFGISTIMIFAGIELMGTRINEIRNPARTYPRATFLAIATTTLLLIPMTLAIAVLVPANELKITAGIVQAVETVFTSVWHLKWVIALFAVALLIDAIGEISGWMAGTPIAMSIAARDGYLPSRLTHQKRGTAPAMLVTQAVIGSSISLLFIVESTVSGVFWVLTTLLVQLYVIMYMLLFASAWRLLRKRADLERAYRVPGGSVGLAVVCSIGIAFSLAVFVVGFIRPASLRLSFLEYEAVLMAALLIILAAPITFIWRQQCRTADRAC